MVSCKDLGLKRFKTNVRIFQSNLGKCDDIKIAKSQYRLFKVSKRYRFLLKQFIRTNTFPEPSLTEYSGKKNK